MYMGALSIEQKKLKSSYSYNTSQDHEMLQWFLFG